MSRTPLFGLIRRSLRLAALPRDAAAPPLDELLEMRRAERTGGASRREFLALSAAAGAVAAAVRPFPSFAAGALSAPRVGIVGAGVAGLNCAYRLKQAGIGSVVFEASSRVGGRMFTARDLLAPGLTTELGGEFIDSGHEEMHALVKELGLRLWDLAALERKWKPEAYFFDGKHVTEKQVIRAFVPLAKKIAADSETLGEVVDYRNHGNGQTLDRMSIAEYLDRIGARGMARELLEVAYVTEYGLEADEQSALNLIQLIGTDTSSGFEAFGESDERYCVRGGNERVVEELGERVADRTELRHRLVAISPKGAGYTLTFDGPNGTPVTRDFDTVVLALPFTLLREVDIRVDLPAVKKKAIAELGYGANAKVLVGFRSRRWRSLGYVGNTFSDEEFQLAWDNSAPQPGTAGGLTFYSGGRRALAAGSGTAQEAADRVMPGFERAYAGSTARRNGKVSRFHWPTHPFTKAAYSCYRPGQWTSIAGAEGEPVGGIFFAGEHTSYDYQGYMNGGAQSGRDAAEAILSAASSKAAELLRRFGTRRRRAA